MSKKLDFNAVNKTALPHLPELLKHWLPDGRLTGTQWEAKNPRRPDANIGSFKINVQTGQWADFAIDAKGVGAISFVAYIFGMPEKQAAKSLAEMLEGKPCNNPMFAALGNISGSKTSTATQVKEWVPVTPVPKNAPAIPEHYKFGEACHRWEYKDTTGKLLFLVMRFDVKFVGKQVLPLTYCKHADGSKEWRWQGLPTPRPLYGLDRLALRPDAPVLVVEGEKAADAAANIFFDYVIVTSAGGANAAHSADWSAVSGRNVKIWPDNDDAGRLYAATVAQLALTVGVLSAAIVGVPAEFPEKWDLADAVPMGWDEAKLQELLCAQAVPINATQVAFSVPTGALKLEAETQTEALLNLAHVGEYFHTPEGVPCVDARIENGQRRTYPIASSDAKGWLTHLYYKRTGDAPSPEALKKAIATLAARAKYDGAEHPVYVRVGGYEGKTYLDLCDDTGGAVEIDAGGWRIVPEPPVRFLRKKGMLSLPTPVSGGSIAMLRRFVNTQDDDGFVLIIAWLLMAMREVGPYPVLVLIGEHGTSKSTLSKILRRLVDPNFSALRTLTGTIKDLFIATANSWVLAFDNLSYMPDEHSDALCRIATGGGYSTRTLYTDDEEHLFEAMRPIMLNGIGNIVTRGDLADRALVVPLKPIAENERKTEKEFRQEIDALLPSILGALLDATAHGFKTIPNIVLTDMPRMADFAKWATACETAIWPSGRFKAAFDANRNEATDYIIAASPIASALREFMEGKKEREHSPTELWNLLASHVDEKITKDRRYWPSNPRVMSEWLKRVTPQLRLVGIEVGMGAKRRGNRLIRIARTAANPAPPPPSTPCPRKTPQKPTKNGRKPSPK